MGIQAPAVNDDCAKMPATFMQLLASAAMVDENGNILGINVTMSTAPDECGCTPYIDCTKNHLTPEQVLAKMFGVDACGNVALKLVNCDGTIDFRSELV